jgi:hypothetical protein
VPKELVKVIDTKNIDIVFKSERDTSSVDTVQEILKDFSDYLETY